MPRFEHILDNRQSTVAEYLRHHLSMAKVFRLVSAYFTIYGFEVLENQLRGIKDIRFLFGDPASDGRNQAYKPCYRYAIHS